MTRTITLTAEQILDGADEEFFSVFVTDQDGYGDPAIDIIPGLEGSGMEPVVSVPLTAETEVDTVLRKHGFDLVIVEVEDTIPQPGVWTQTAFGRCATAVKMNA